VLPNIPTSKKGLRAYFSDIRRQISPEYAKDGAFGAARRFFTENICKSGDIIGAYYPIHEECSTQFLLCDAVNRGFETALPVVVGEGKPLIFRKWRWGEDLEYSKFRVKEPPSSAEEVVPNIMFIPLLAFDDRGHRLGYGRGFYDRTIADFRKKGTAVIAIGYGYESQFIEELPADEHDELLDYVVTPKRVIECKGE